MERLLARIRRVQPEYRERGRWRLLHDNTPAHRPTLITDFLPKTENHLSIPNCFDERGAGLGERAANTLIGKGKAGAFLRQQRTEKPLHEIRGKIK